MSHQPVITVNSLSKTYKLYHSHRDRLKEIIHPLRKCYHKKYHALKDVSIDIEKGEVVGIIGQNGSGKSTLLKILASVVTPSSGSYSCTGRVAALLELGGGFNKDLSGVENIYFMGGVQGYTRKEMHKRIQVILDFADIGVYADQPINNYSSGMYLRLAFSMAINIDPEILIIDEALAVGDFRFQQKCFRKIREFKDQGKTMLLCTHSFDAVRDFCTRAIWLHEGKIMEQGSPIFVTDCYKAFMTAKGPPLFVKKPSKNGHVTGGNAIHDAGTSVWNTIDWDDTDGCDSYGFGGANIRQVAMYEVPANLKTYKLTGGEKIRVYIHLVTVQQIENPEISLTFNGRFGSALFQINSLLDNEMMPPGINKPSVIALDFTFPHIGNGNYSISLGILDGMNGIRRELHWIHDAIAVEVANPDSRYKLGTQLVIEDAAIQVHSC